MDRLRVLVVDDELGMRLGAQRVLKRFEVALPVVETTVGFDVDLAENGQQALDLLANQVYDISLLDYKLPDINGLEILHHITEKKLDMRVIMITAFASLDVAVSATRSGAFDFLAKPFTPDELEGAVTKAARSLMHQRQARRLAEEKRKVRFQFLSVLSHELKAPLGAIEGYLRLMKERVMGDQLDAYEQPMARALLRIEGMRKMIYDMLDLTRIESGEKKRVVHEVEVLALLRHCMENSQAEAARRGIRIELQAPESMPFLADTGDLEIVFNNLISNAVKYNRPDGRVFIELARAEGGLRLQVRDTGIGMSADEQKKLFGEFVRMKNEKTIDIPGSGLGLSTVKKIVALNGGSIEAQSEPDVGSTFTVFLKESPPSETPAS